MSDTTDEYVLFTAANADYFQQRCQLRFLAAAIAVSNESSSITSHAQRLAFSGALFNNSVSLQTLAMLVLASSINKANCLANQTGLAGGNILDADIDSQITSIFTGVATSRSW
jgi:hypothetical protein